MFDKLLQNMPGIGDMLKQMNTNLKDIKATGEAAAGMVRVTVNGSHEIEEIHIDDEMMKLEEKDTLIKLIKGAHNVATKRVQEKTQEQALKMASNIDPSQLKK